MKKAVIGLIAAGIALLLSWQFIARTISAACLRRLTGVTAELRSTKIGWKHGTFEVRALTCTNLHAAGTLITADVPWLRIDYDIWSLFRPELHVYELSSEIQKLSIVHQPSQRNGNSEHHANASHSSVRVDVLRLKLDGSFSYDNQNVTGKMQATLHDVRDIESFRSLLKSP